MPRRKSLKDEEPQIAQAVVRALAIPAGLAAIAFALGGQWVSALALALLACALASFSLWMQYQWLSLGSYAGATLVFVLLGLLVFLLSLGSTEDSASSEHAAPSSSAATTKPVVPTVDEGVPGNPEVVDSPEVSVSEPDQSIDGASEEPSAVLGQSLIETWGLDNIQGLDKPWILRFSRDGSLLAGGAQSGGVEVWRTESGETLCSFDLGDWVYGLDFSADGEQIATSSSNGLAQIWDLGTCEETMRLPHSRYVVERVLYSRSDGTIYTASRDGTGSTITQWDNTGTLLGTADTEGMPYLNILLYVGPDLAAMDGENGRVAVLPDGLLDSMKTLDTGLRAGAAGSLRSGEQIVLAHGQSPVSLVSGAEWNDIETGPDSMGCTEAVLLDPDEVLCVSTRSNAMSFWSPNPSEEGPTLPEPGIGRLESIAIDEGRLHVAVSGSSGVRMYEVSDAG